jgi:hypothetical protein
MMKKLLVLLVVVLALCLVWKVANASVSLYTNASVALTQASSNFSSGTVDASGHENLTFSFTYEAESLDNGDSFVYGWSAGGTDHDLGTIPGINEGTTGDESGSVNEFLPVGAQTSDLSLYVRATVNSGADNVNLTGIGLSGDAAVVIVGTITNDESETYSTLQEAVDGTDAGGTIELNADLTTSAQVNVMKPLTIDGNGFTLNAVFAKTDNSNNSGIGIINTSDVTVRDLTVSGAGSTNLHGVNVYQSTGINLENVTISDFGRAAGVVNGSEVTVNNITTANNGWGGINVDLGSGVTSPAVLTVNGTSHHTEVNADIWVDNITKDVSVIDTNQQYASSTTGNLRTYKLDTEPPVITLIGDASMTVFTSNGFVDPGATVTDNVSVGLVATVTGSVDASVPGAYELTYNATDFAGNPAVPVIRNVVVIQSSNGGGTSNNQGGVNRAGNNNQGGNNPGNNPNQGPGNNNAGGNGNNQSGQVLGAFTEASQNITDTATGQVLGLFTVTPPSKSYQIAFLENQITTLMQELVGLLQAQVAAVIKARGN